MSASVPGGPVGHWRRTAASARALVLCAGLTALMMPGAAVADQTDARLGSLFEELARAPDPVTAGAVEAEIWDVWLQSGDAAVDAIMGRGIGAMSQGDLAAAIALFDQAVERAPNYAEAWNKRATAYYLNDDYAASVNDIRVTLTLEPRHFGALSGMGLIFLETGDPRGALAAFEAVLDVHPQAVGARARVEALRERFGPVGS